MWFYFNFLYQIDDGKSLASHQLCRNLRNMLRYQVIFNIIETNYGGAKMFTPSHKEVGNHVMSMLIRLIKES